MRFQFTIPAFLKAAIGGYRSISSRLRGAVIESSRDIYADLWRKWVFAQFYSHSLWLRAIRFANASKERIRNASNVSWLTIRAWLRSAETWQAQVDANSQLRNEIVGLKAEVVAHKQTISVLRNRRFQDQDLILGLLRLHETEALNNLSSHPAVAKIVALSLATALLKTQTEVKKIYGE